jgi:hypothetical protein
MVSIKKTDDTIVDVLLEKPLYTRTVISGPVWRALLTQLPRFNYRCRATCDSTQTFGFASIDNGNATTYHENISQILQISHVTSKLPISVGNCSYLLAFKCLRCLNYEIKFVLLFKETIDTEKKSKTTEVWKIGQYPAMEDTLDPVVEKWFSETDLDLYRKGARCEAHGFGIAAFSYFRRILEDNIEKILDELEKNTDNDELRVSIKASKKKHTAAERLKIVKDHTPSSLKVGDRSMFDILYAALSDGLHNKPDDKCLSLATNIRSCLSYLIKTVEIANSERKLIESKFKAIDSTDSSQPGDFPPQPPAETSVPSKG